MTEPTPPEATATVSVRAQAHDLKAKFNAYMLARAQNEDVSDGEAISESIDYKILTANSWEEAMAAMQSGTIQARDIPGTEVTVHDMRVIRSDREFDDSDGTSTGYYISCNATCVGIPADVARTSGLAPGRDFILQTGASHLVSIIRAAEAFEKLPHTFVIVGTRTASGNTVLTLAEPPERAVQSTLSE
jgi:hypothetical protein